MMAQIQKTFVNNSLGFRGVAVLKTRTKHAVIYGQAY